MGNNRRREVQDEKEKMEQSFIRTFRSVYKELHADHKTGAADNK